MIGLLLLPLRLLVALLLVLHGMRLAVIKKCLWDVGCGWIVSWLGYKCVVCESEKGSVIMR